MISVPHVAAPIGSDLTVYTAHAQYSTTLSGNVMRPRAAVRTPPHLQVALKSEQGGRTALLDYAAQRLG